MNNRIRLLKKLLKEVVWDKNALGYVKELEIETRREIGTLIMMLQNGETLGPPQSKVFRSLHDSGYELRIKDRNGAHRVFYVLLFKDKIFIPYAFNKKTEKTHKREIDTAKARLNILIKGNKQ